MAVGGGQVGPHLAQVVGIVEHQQPAIVFGQPLFHQGDYCLLIVLLVARDLDRLGQSYIAGDQLSFLLGPDPEHMVILALVAVGIFQSGLGFANAPQPRQTGSASAGEGRMDGL